MLCLSALSSHSWWRLQLLPYRYVTDNHPVPIVVPKWPIILNWWRLQLMPYSYVADNHPVFTVVSKRLSYHSWWVLQLLPCRYVSNNRPVLTAVVKCPIISLLVDTTAATLQVPYLNTSYTDCCVKVPYHLIEGKAHSCYPTVMLLTLFLFSLKCQSTLSSHSW